MNPIRRELLNGVFVLVVASLLSAAFAAFQANFNVLLWVLIVMGMAMAVGGYAVFEFVLSNQAEIKRTEQRELEWLKRVGNPARLELTRGLTFLADAVKAMRPGSDLTMMIYIDRQGRTIRTAAAEESREELFRTVMEQVKRGTVREYKRLICFDPEALANESELKSGILTVAQGFGTIDRRLGEHCRQMLETKGCSVYVAPVVFRTSVVGLFGADKVTMAVDSFDQQTGIRTLAGVLFFHDPPNAEIIEQFRQMEPDTEKRMVAVHKIVFPEDATAPAVESASR
jgi:hypothetical protein